MGWIGNGGRAGVLRLSPVPSGQATKSGGCGLAVYLAQACTEGVHVDTIFAVLVCLSTLIAVGVFTTIIYFIWKYRRGAAANRSNPPAQNTRLEFLCITILLVLGLIMFTWAASQYFNMANPPANALEIFVVGKQWMWKV